MGNMDIVECCNLQGLPSHNVSMVIIEEFFTSEQNSILMRDFPGTIGLP
jgi:hypothetical protein